VPVLVSSGIGTLVPRGRKILKNNRCTEQATEHGFIDQPHLWANLGQGAPEVGDEIEGSFPRPTSIPISVNAREYGPTAGIKPLRQAIAKLYNDNYRQGKESQYTWENVCVVPGGRAGLIRIAAVLGNAYVGFFIPDYTAYNEMLGLFKNVSLSPCPKASMGTPNLMKYNAYTSPPVRRSPQPTLCRRRIPHPRRQGR
jgi:aspartate/methionine/tyrosine aminotransferase